LEVRKQTKTTSRLDLRKCRPYRLLEGDIITIDGGSSHTKNPVNWLIEGNQFRSDCRSNASFDFVSLNCSADYTPGYNPKARLIGWQKVKCEIRRRMTLSSFDDIANLVA